MLILTAVAAIGGLTAVLASALVLANRFLHVEEDPRIDTVEAMLPATNCGGCGYPGCRPFAEALVSGECHCYRASCSVSTDAEGHARIAEYLGVEVGAEARRVARLACAGGANVARNHAQLRPDCGRAAPRRWWPAAARAASGAASASADCEVACGLRRDHTWTPIRLPVVDEDTLHGLRRLRRRPAPRTLFSLRSREPPPLGRLPLAARRATRVLEDCQVACTACGRCAMDAPADMITMQKRPARDRLRASGARRTTEPDRSAAPPAPSSGSTPTPAPVKGRAAARSSARARAVDDAT